MPRQNTTAVRVARAAQIMAKMETAMSMDFMA
jgi:hypothetical protein